MTSGISKAPWDTNSYSTTVAGREERIQIQNRFKPHFFCQKVCFSTGESLHLTTDMFLGGVDYGKCHKIVTFISILTDFTKGKVTFWELISTLLPCATKLVYWSRAEKC